MRNHHGWGQWPHNQNNHLINQFYLLITSRTGATSAACQTRRETPRKPGPA